jgi:hypothetical protein
MCMMITLGGFLRLARRNEKSGVPFHRSSDVDGRDESSAILRPKLRSGVGIRGSLYEFRFSPWISNKMVTPSYAMKAELLHHAKSRPQSADCKVDRGEDPINLRELCNSE